MNTVQLGEKRVKPSKVVCVGRNYMEHIKELENAIPDQMVVFNKPNSSISKRLLSFHEEPLHYEAEICFLVRRKKLAAVGFGLDLTKRRLQSELKQKGLPWERAKAFDHSAVLSRFVPLDGHNVADLNLELYINGIRIQSGHVGQMLYPPAVILQELSRYTTLETSDIIMTGTPKGVGVITAGDKFTGRVKCADKTLVEAEWVAE
ncbi:fumarylacetoacetate hydrolase family protein [Vibrio sp. SCSIO 43137]|uniref:fumarylacetoacetate hydrolase family protein n=1 Tax=Vibrio sp. SCSIO 43137 TaxID=3021011 RepID=UPI0023081B51|nr:fumarylacetoacetate hydrolase family protein [Vibrio sp. SCSIO 43137]WCE32328.1 fumarylacetoacetate hydrolase family protein [Vibrio sp. SCSIO 43137]